MTEQAKEVTFGGIVIRIHESSILPNTVTVDIETGEAEPRFSHPNGSPRLRVFVNDECSDSLPEGGWEVS